jgi:hypothetical protein
METKNLEIFIVLGNNSTLKFIGKVEIEAEGSLKEWIIKSNINDMFLNKEIKYISLQNKG